MQQHTSTTHAAAAISNPKPPAPSNDRQHPNHGEHTTCRGIEQSSTESSPEAGSPAPQQRRRREPASAPEIRAGAGSRRRGAGAGAARTELGAGDARGDRGGGAHPSLRGRAPVHAERQRRGAVVAVLRGAGGLLPPRRRRRHRRRAARNGGIGADESAEASRRRFRSFPLVLEGD